MDAALLEGLGTVTIGSTSLPLTGAGGLLDLGPAAGAPDTGPTGGGTTVTITGTGLDAVTEVTFGGLAGTALTVAPDGTTLTVVTPASPTAGPVPVVLASPNGDADGGDFTYVAPPPAVTDLAPATGPNSGGTTVTVTGTDLGTVTEVTFGGVQGTGLTITPDGTSLTVVTPATDTAGAAPVELVSSAGDAAAGDFTYVAPTLMGVDPAQGPESGGSVVTLSGTGLDAATGVTFDGVPATAVTVTDGVVTATAPAGTGVVDVVVELPGVDATLADAFTYLPDGSGATVSDVTPDGVSTTGGTVVTIVGDGLEDATDVTFGGTPGTDVVVAPDGTSITVVAPPSETGGPVDVVVVFPGGQVPAGPVTYVAPTVSAVTPASGPTTGGTAGTGTGTGRLATTGASDAWALLAALTMVLVGAALVVPARRARARRA